jgi:predicted metal-dependent hydrolase
MNKTTWPPDYTLQRSPRAKRIIFKVSLKRGLIVVIPKRFALRHIPPAMENARGWIEKHLSTVTAHHTEVADAPLPDSMTLPAVDQTWPIVYRAGKSSLMLKRSNKTLVFSGTSDIDMAHHRILIKWLIDHGKTHLIPWLEQLSTQHNLPFNNATIRNQKSRWGSCSSQHNINLNCKLLLMPKPVAEHILLHELSHTQHLNHSKAFWSLLESLDPDYTANKKLAKKAGEHLPTWARLV